MLNKDKKEWERDFVKNYYFLEVDILEFTGFKFITSNYK